MIQYRFLNVTKLIQSSESTRIYPSVRLRLRQLENNERLKKAVSQVEKEKGA